MRRYQSNVFEQIELDELFESVAELKERGFKFVQLCASTLESSCELLYTFIAPDANDGTLNALVVDVPDGVAVPSITELYPAAFVFENETHDLFGIDIYGINIDFQGEFYKVSEKFPMNPRAAVEHVEQDVPEGEEAAHE